MSAMLKVTLAQQTIAEELDARLKAIAGERVMFSLFIWHPTENKTNYVSTADRDEVMRVLGTMIDKWRAGAPPVPL